MKSKYYIYILVLAVDKIQNIDQQSNDDIQIQPDITLRKILMGQSYSLEPYKSLASKTALLDSAVKSGNGNAILIVIIYTYIYNFLKSFINIYINYKHLMYLYFLDSSISYKNFKEIFSLSSTS